MNLDSVLVRSPLGGFRRAGKCFAVWISCRSTSKGTDIRMHARASNSQAEPSWYGSVACSAPAQRADGKGAGIKASKGKGDAVIRSKMTMRDRCFIELDRLALSRRMLSSALTLVDVSSMQRDRGGVLALSGHRGRRSREEDPRRTSLAELKFQFEFESR